MTITGALLSHESPYHSLHVLTTQEEIIRIRRNLYSIVQGVFQPYRQISFCVIGLFRLTFSKVPMGKLHFLPGCSGMLSSQFG